jgi:hypothetical protein
MYCGQLSCRAGDLHLIPLKLLLIKASKGAPRLFIWIFVCWDHLHSLKLTVFETGAFVTNNPIKVQPEIFKIFSSLSVHLTGTGS